MSFDDWFRAYRAVYRDTQNRLRSAANLQDPAGETVKMRFRSSSDIFGVVEIGIEIAVPLRLLTFQPGEGGRAIVAVAACDRDGRVELSRTVAFELPDPDGEQSGTVAVLELDVVLDVPARRIGVGVLDEIGLIGSAAALDL